MTRALVGDGATLETPTITGSVAAGHTLALSIGPAG
jgi:hypothetical protein